MKIYILLFLILNISINCLAQDAKVVVFKHDLRWTDESRFPNYFLMPEIKDSVFLNTRLDLMNYLKLNEIEFPNEVEYKIYNGFGKQKIEMPKSASSSKPGIGIFSFITRATTGFAMFWNFRIIIIKDNKTLLNREVNHELEYFNPAGYQTAMLWISPKEFQNIFNRLVKETLGFLPSGNEKIVLGSLESFEAQIRDLSPLLKKNVFKVNGAWKNGGNFSARLESENDTLMNLYYKQGFSWELSVPTFSTLLAGLFTATTGIDMLYNQKVINQLNGTVNFSDGKKEAIRLRWIEMETRTVLGDEGIMSYISEPVTAEIFDQKSQIGYFLYTMRQKVNQTENTTEKFNIYTGVQQSNTLGVEKLYRIEGSLSGKPIVAEYNEHAAIIKITSGNEVLGAMLVQNINPENTTISESKLSKNKKVMSSVSQNITRPSTNDDKKLEWYPVYLPENTEKDNTKMCLEILICLFMSLGI